MSGGDGYEPSYISVGGGRVCPPLQMARDFINGDASNLVELFRDSMFLADLRKMTAETSRGCILLEDPGKCGDSWNNRVR